MARDIIGNTLKPGKKIFFQGIVYEIEDIQENRLIGGKTMTGKNITGLKIPDSITLRVTLPFDANQPFNGICVETPTEEQGVRQPN